jgi:hypothetical protein
MAEIPARGIGIDFGAHTCRVVAVEGRREVLCGSFAVPEAARDLCPEERRWQPVKRYLGDAHLPSGRGGSGPRVNAAVTAVLQELRRQIEDQLRASVLGAAISLPPFSADRQLAAAQHCLEAAGFEKAMVVDDARAAVLAYCNTHSQRGRWLVYGLGASAFFVSFVDSTSGMAVRAHGGDNLLGGDDFDALIADHVARSGYQPAFAGMAIAGQAQQARVLLLQAEKWKRALSSVESVPLDERGAGRLSRSEVESLIGERVESTLRIAHQTLAKAGLVPGDIDLVLLVGGSTHIPVIQERLRRDFGAPLAHVEEHMVARGAAILATRLETCFTEGPAALEEGGEISVFADLAPAGKPGSGDGSAGRGRGAPAPRGAESDPLRGLSGEWRQALTRVADWLRHRGAGGALPGHREFQRALMEHMAELCFLYAQNLAAAGQLDEAIKCGDEAHELDGANKRIASALSSWYAERAAGWRQRWKAAQASGHDTQASRFRAECKRDAERSWRLDPGNDKAREILADRSFERRSGRRRV